MTAEHSSLFPFALFSGEYYYPLGGWDDFVESFATLAEAKAAHIGRSYEWAHIVDLSTGEIVARQEGARGEWEANRVVA